MADACAAAKIEPPVTFHELRDTFASHLVMAGVPILTVSKLLGHADVRITEKHYAHLAPGHLQNAVDEHLPDFSVHPRRSKASPHSKRSSSNSPRSAGTDRTLGRPRQQKKSSGARSKA